MKVLSWPGRSFSENPYIAALCAALERGGASVSDFTPQCAVARTWDVVHVHWPEQIFWKARDPVKAAAYASGVLFSLAAARLRGAAIIWTVHNLRPHEMSPAERTIWKALSALLPRCVDGFITLSPSTLDIVRQVFPGLARKPGRAIIHGHYRDCYPRGAEKTAAREALGLDPGARVIVHPGLVRRYKGIDQLIQSFMDLRCPDTTLVIAGRPVPEAYGDALSSRVRGDRRIRLELGFQSQEKLALLLSAADLVVLPFESGLHSGSLLLALSFSRPTLVRRTPYASDIAALVGDSWVRLLTTPLDPEVLAQALSWGSASRPREGPPMAAFGWEAIGEQTLDFYQAVRAASSAVTT
jgi:beta-1,4-mannosyltransferase